MRPLDPSGAIPGTVPVYFEYYPHTDAGPSEGTLVATEGGPGYPATESRRSYLALFQPLLSSRDLVLMDNRGTGRSAAIDCKPLQTDPRITEQNVATCGRALGVTAPTYSAAFATDDLAAILDALGVGRIDLYGDSYGTFFEQVFALRHPEKLRSLVLDGAYPLNAPDYAWYPNYAPAMRAKYELACERSAECRRMPGSSLEHILPAVKALREAPADVEAKDADGRSRRFKADATALAITMFGSAPAYATVRELDAAARAFVSGDRVPLLRLMAETQVSVDSRDAMRSPAKFSAGLAAAVTCQDAPQIFDMKLDPAARIAQRERIIADRKRVAPGSYAPFTLDEYRGMPLDYAFIDECVRWPALANIRPASESGATNSYPDVPALIVSGDLDNMTPVADGTLVAKHFRRGQQLIVPNGFHVNALPHARSRCPADLVREFITKLRIVDASCLKTVPPVRLLAMFARASTELEPASPIAGNEATAVQLRAVRAAILTAGDAIARIETNTTGRSVGLRGGTFDIAEHPDGYTLSLHDVRWTEDVSVTGTIHWPGRSGIAEAQMSLSGAAIDSGSIHVRWMEGIPESRARIQGRLGAMAVAAETPAP